MELFKIFGTIALNGTDDFNNQCDEAAGSGRTLSQSLGQGIGTAAKIGGAAILAVGTAIVAGTKAIIDGTREVASYGDHVDKMSQKIGISAQAYQEWDFVMGQCGMSIDTMQVGMKTLSEAAVSGNEAFSKLGITEQELATLGTEDLFNRTVDALAGMEAGAERTALATDLFGRSATEMMPLLNQGAEGIEALRQQALDYGLVLSDETIAASAAFTDSLTLMSKTFNGLKNRMMAEFLPSLTLVTDGLANLFRGDMSGLDQINQGITDFINTVTDILPQLLEIGASIVISLAEAIIANIPQLISAGMQIINQLLSAILANLPLLLTAGIEAIIMIVSGISEALPTLIPAIVDVVLMILETLIQNAPLLIEAGLQLLIQLAAGIWEALPTIIAAIPELLAELLNTFISLAGIFVSAGAEYVSNLLSGISGAWGALVSVVSSLWGSVSSVISGKVAAIASAVSGKFASIKNSIKSAIEGARDIVRNAIDKIKGFFNFSWNFPHLKLPHIVYSMIEVPVLGSIPDPRTLSVSWYKNGGIMTEPTAFGINGNSLMVGGEAGDEAIAPIDLLQGYVAQAVAQQNAGIVDALEKILSAINKMNADMGDNLSDALDGTSLSINTREFGRLVRGVI